jgi:AraC family transcriptional regulator
MLLRSLPDLSSGNAEFTQWFHSKWGRENCIIWGHSRHADFGPFAHTLSIRAVWGGAQHCQVGRRTLAVDDDNFLILNHGRVYATSIRAMRPVESFVVCFRPGLVEQIHGAMAASIDCALSQGDTIAERPTEFMENLHPHDQGVTPVLRFIRAHLAEGLDDEKWYEEQLIFLLERMRSHEARIHDYVDRLRLVRPATRREIFRRIRLATDFLHTNYARSWDLASLAKVAYLSKYHFLRLFTLVHGVTPFAYLQRKRARVAWRLLESTQLTVNEVAAHVGFTTGSALVRQLRRWTGFAPRQIRSVSRAPAARAACELSSALGERR